MQTVQHMLRTGQRGAPHAFGMAFQDLRNSGLRIGLAWSLAWHDIVSRYRGSLLGPFWITLSMGLMVLGISVLYSNLFSIPLNEFMPFVALGIVFFGLISQTVLEGCQTFVQASGMLSQTALPILTFVWRTVFRNLITLAHHLVIVAAVLIWYGAWRKADVPLAVFGVVLVALNISWLSLLVGIFSARFRDIPQVVASVMQFAMFMTPVFWQPTERLIGHAVLHANPFYHMLQVVRGPLLGDPDVTLSFIVMTVMAVVGWAVSFTIFTFTRRRIVHYL